MYKAKIIDKKSVDSVLGEKNILSQLHHPFIVNMIYSFQDHDFLYLIMDLLPGGNLRYHLGIKRQFTEKQNKFLIACILVGLEYIHGENILHRDIKPENLVFDENGYLRITDFGIAKKYTVNNKKDTSGTVGYLAPEVLCNRNHNFSIDYYAVGIITYELAYGHRPYIGKTKHEVKQLILTKQAHIDYDDLPNGYENEAADFINKLIQRNPKNRLGKDSIKEVIGHPWLNGFEWEKMKQKTLKAYYIPKEGDNYDKKYCSQNNKISTETSERYKLIINEPNYNIIFKRFDCQKIPDELRGQTIHNKLPESAINSNANLSSNNSTALISINNKNLNNNNINIVNGNNIVIIDNNNNNNNNNIKNNNNNMNNNINNNINNNNIVIENKNKKSLLSKYKNKSMENIFVKHNNDNSSQRKIFRNEIDFAKKELIKQKSAINISAKNLLDNSDREKNEDSKNKIAYKEMKIEKEIEKDIEKEKEREKEREKEKEKEKEKHKEYKLLFNKKNDNVINKFSFNKKYNENNENKEINNLKDIYNNNVSSSNYEIFRSIKEKKNTKDNIDASFSNLEKRRNKNILDEILLINNNQNNDNLNQYLSNNFKHNNNSNKLSNSNSSINILPNDLFSNIKGYYYKKMVNNKILTKDSSKIKNKTSNSLIGSSSARSLFNNPPNINENYSTKSKKHYLKKEIFNGTFYPNKSAKYFVISSSNKLYKKRKTSASFINKNIDLNNNKKLTSSSSSNNLFQNKNDRNDNREFNNLSGFLSKIDFGSTPNITKKKITDNNDKKLPFINLAVNSKKANLFRNNLHLVNRNTGTNKNYIKNSGFFSERMKKNELTKLNFK